MSTIVLLKYIYKYVVSRYRSAQHLCFYRRWKVNGGGVWAGERQKSKFNNSGYASTLFQWTIIGKWKHAPRYWPFVRGIHLSPVISPHKGQWRGALMFSLIFARIKGWVNNGEAGDLATPSCPLWRHCDAKLYPCHAFMIQQIPNSDNQIEVTKRV